MPERKNNGILSLNVKKLLTLHLVWKTNRMLQYGSLFFIMRLILVRTWRDNLPKYGRTITFRKVLFRNCTYFVSLTSFHFAEEIYKQDYNLHMASLNVDSLFTNIPLEETIDICVDNLYNDNENLPNITEHNFRNLLNIATKESFFMLNNKYFKQVWNRLIISVYYLILIFYHN